MKLVCEPINVVKQILPKQDVNKSEIYRKIFYMIELPVDGGYLISNTLTHETIFLEDGEISILNDPDIVNPNVRYLIEAYFLVPQNFDDKKFGLQVMNTRIQIQSITRNPPLSYFAILPTTGCNARCFYCFEKGAKVSNMTEQTAHDVADFIERKGTKKIKILWFGGEPLVNLKAIDTISKDLKDKNIEYSSRMVSNAYLLDETAIKKAVELWNLDTIQITLDGTEEVYNKVKNYVYKNVSSPFKKVLNNIENALKANIQVNIRLNMGEHNAADLFELSKMLVKRFNQYNNCSIYVVRLYDGTCPEIRSKTTDDRHKLIEDAVILQDFIDSNMPISVGNELPKSSRTTNTCMACCDNATMIVPDGHLGKCEHFVDSDFYGSIYSDEYDMENIKKYKEYIVVGPQCDDCELRSLCLHLKRCTSIPNHCDDIDKMAIRTRFESKLMNIYNIFLKLEKENQ